MDYNFYPELEDSFFAQKIYAKKEFHDLKAEKERRSVEEICSPQRFELQKPQMFLRNYLSSTSPYNGILVFWSTGLGKCFAPGTPIMMADGRTLPVELIKVGDLLMGDDSKPRRVLSLAQGVAEMYRVSQIQGSYTVNGDHVLTLYSIPDRRPVDIDVETYMGLDWCAKKGLYGFRVPVEFPPTGEGDRLIDPYWMAMEIRGGIPEQYLYAPRSERLKLLAGFIERDLSPHYEILCDSYDSLKDVVYLIRSLGLHAECFQDMHLEVYGDVVAIPLRQGERTPVDPELQAHVVNLTYDGALLYPIAVESVAPGPYYGFAVDGNHRFLLEDFSVTHNSCGALSISEGLKADRHFTNKTIILTDLQDQFKSQIFNVEKLKKGVKGLEQQCTGERYLLSEEEMRILSIDQKVALVKKKIKDNYEIIGPIAFANKVKRDVSLDKKNPWDGTRAGLTDDMKRRIKQLYSNRVIIIDEVQNIKSIYEEDKEEKKIVPPVIKEVIRYAEGVKLVLMSATPMFDNAREIMYIINLLLLNDKREELKMREVFDQEGNFVEGGEEKFREACRGYISYQYGKNPIVFPVRIYPKGAVVPKGLLYGPNGEPAEESVRYTRLIRCPMSKFQEQWYQHYTSEGGARTGDRALTNIIFENRSGKGVFSKAQVYDDYQAGKGIFLERTTRHRFRQYEYKGEGPVPLALGQLERYSSKFAEAIKNIMMARGGISLVYSFYITSGVVPFCMALEMNGFTRYTKGTHEPPMLKGPKPDPICYYCSQRKSASVHAEGARGGHKFFMAQYIVATGEPSINKRDAVAVAEEVNKRLNADGRMIKVVVGNQVISEGLDLKRLRQVHILEPWYNLSKQEQIIGRADRFCSHSDLPEEDRNVEIYLYALAHGKSATKEMRARQTIDEKNYAVAEAKDIRIKAVERVMKEEAIDCALNIAINQFASSQRVWQRSVTGERLKVSLGGEPYSPLCDYRADCNYKCSWQPAKGEEVDINTNTYRLQSSERDISKVKGIIRTLFRQDVNYNLHRIRQEVRERMGEVDDLIIYRALDELLHSQRAVLQDRYSRDGRLIYRGEEYVFQPSELGDDRLPVYYRRKMPTLKPAEADLSIEVFEMPTPEVSRGVEKKKTREPSTVSSNVIYQKLISALTKYFTSMKSLIERHQIEGANDLLIAMGCDRLSPKDRLALIGFLLTKPDSSSLDDAILAYFGDNLFRNEEGRVEGYYVDDVFMCREGKEFVPCTADKVYRFKKDMKEPAKKKKGRLAKIHGLFSYSKKGELEFKIVDQTAFKEHLTKSGEVSGRSIIKGRVCTSFKATELARMAKYIGMVMPFASKVKGVICAEFELLFRYFDSIKKDGLSWITWES